MVRKISKILISLLVGLGILYLITRETTWGIVVGSLLIVTIAVSIVVPYATRKKDPNDQSEFADAGFGDKDEREPMDEVILEEQEEDGIDYNKIYDIEDKLERKYASDKKKLDAKWKEKYDEKYDEKKELD